jgi:hypothetical protein
MIIQMLNHPRVQTPASPANTYLPLHSNGSMVSGTGFENWLKTPKNDTQNERISSGCLQERSNWIEEKGPFGGSNHK